jgi:membrane-bound lytic murein transglycosylase D
MNTLLKLLIALLLVFGLMVVGQLFLFSTSKEDPVTDNTFQKHFNSNYKIYALTIPENLDFAGEPVPLDVIDVRERFDRELLINTYWQSQSLLFHKRANRYFPVIEPILEQNGVPDDFKYLALIESGLMNVVSPAGATGFWQFMKNTGLEYGLEVNTEVDERYHLEKSTHAACKYLKTAYKRYGSWSMAAASYNLGMNGLDKQVNRQKVNNYYDLLLPEETSRYVFRILAAKEIMSNPENYGFHLREKDLYPPFNTVHITVDKPVNDFAEFAFQHGVNYKILKVLNPWLRDTFIKNPTGKKYQIALPGSDNSGLVPIDTLHQITEPLLTDSV